MNNKLEDFFSRIKNNEINHSFIIANTSLDNIKNDIESIISKYILKQNIDLFTSNNIYIVRPDGLFISKDSIIEMQKNLMTTSMEYNKKIYIIDECEKLNLYSANSLLKLLEEPGENIYGFLITKNIETVLPTIKSRCQKIFVSSEFQTNKSEYFSEESLKRTIDFIKLIEEKKLKTIAYYNELEFITNKEELKEIFQIMLYIYRDCINFCLEKKCEYFDGLDIYGLLLKHNNIKNLTYKLSVINDIIIKLNYNLNITLLLDKFIIEFGGAKNDKNS